MLNRRKFTFGMIAGAIIPAAVAQRATAQVKELTKAAVVRSLLTLSDRCSKQGGKEPQNIAAWRKMAIILLDCAQQILAVKIS